MSDYKGARLIVDVLPPAKWLLANSGYDADWFRDALREKGIKPCVPAKKNRKQKIKFNGKLYKQRHKFENMFGKLKDWRRVATRYDRCAHTFFSTICIAAFVVFYLNQCVLTLVYAQKSVSNHNQGLGVWNFSKNIHKIVSNRIYTVVKLSLKKKVIIW